MTDSNATELLPCPFCGGEAELSSRKAVNGRKLYRYHCSECHAAIGMWNGGISGHPWTAREAWNTRTPEQAVAATLGVPTLTADDIRRLVEEHSYPISGSTREFWNGSYNDMADELNATLGADDGSRWYELFGTPERAARTLARKCCECVIIDDCDREGCLLSVCSDEYEAEVLEWLCGKAVKR